MVSGISVEKGRENVLVSVNPEIYPLDVIYSAAYVFLDKAYILLNGDPKKEIIVELKPKEKYDLEKLGGEFFNELLNYAFYKKQSEKNARIREAILQRALITSELSQETPKFEEGSDDLIEDPEGIAIPWEEKYDKKQTKKEK